MIKKLIFLDTETTSLDRRRRRIWEIGYIIRHLPPDDGRATSDVEKHCFLRQELDKADQASLKVGRYYARHPNPHKTYIPGDPSLTDYAVVQDWILPDFAGATIVGAVPSFDEESLASMVRQCGMLPTWNHHLVDIASMAMGLFPDFRETSFNSVLAQLGIEYDPDERHTALGDARLVRDAYDVMANWPRTDSPTRLHIDGRGYKLVGADAGQV
jgi:DNA polymerase III epsilon subunit-like protein